MKHVIKPFLMLSLLLMSGLTFAQDDTADLAECEDGFRPVVHFMGVTCVSEIPERVVVLDTGELDSVLTLGVMPVGTVEVFEGYGVPHYLTEATEDVTLVGTIAAPNLERILELEPDLIISSALRHEEIYPELSAIAPTVFAEQVGVVWKENFMLTADALNRVEEAEAVMERYDERLETLAEAMEETSVGEPSEIEVSIVRFVAGQNRVMQLANFIGTIFADAGFSRPESQQSDTFMITVDKEGIQTMDGDVLFYSVFGDPESTDVESFTNDPLWQTLQAVQNERAYQVSDDTWMLAIGPTGANLVIDDLFSFFAPDYVEETATDAAESADEDATPEPTEESGS